MSFNNVKLWFAKDGNENIVTIDEISEENKINTYLCPVCGSNLKPKATKSKRMSPHFAHVDASKCNSESQIHFWFKHKFLEKGDEFTVTAEKTKGYVCKEVLVEQSYDAGECTYRPDVTVITECGNTIYFEMAFSNKKKVKDYLDVWLELKNIVVEVDIKQLMLKNRTPTFKALFYEGKCFNTKRNDTYYNTIGKYKEEKMKGNVDDEIKERIRKLDWFWDDVFRYKKGEVDIEHMANLIDGIEGKEKEIVDKVLSRQSCSHLKEDYRKYHKGQYLKGMEKFEKEIRHKYNGLIEIDYSKASIYPHINIYSTLREDGKRIKIGSSSGGGYLNKHTLNSNINYVNKAIKWELEDIRKTNEQDRIIKNTYLLNSIKAINNKYEDIDDSYKLTLDWNGRYGSTSSLYHVYLKLSYNNVEVLSIDITNIRIVKTANEEAIFNFIESEIHKYREKITSFKNKKELIHRLDEIVEKYKIIKSILPNEFYEHGYSNTEMISYHFANEGLIRFDIRLPYNEHGFYNHNSKCISIYRDHIDYWDTSKGEHTIIKIDYKNIDELLTTLKSISSKRFNEYMKFKCLGCKSNFKMPISEIKFFQENNLHLPKRCKTCREKRKQNKRIKGGS